LGAALASSIRPKLIAFESREPLAVRMAVVLPLRVNGLSCLFAVTAQIPATL
jgi:hypothetical protein